MHRLRLTPILALWFVLVAGGCATGGNTAATPRTDYDVLTREQILSTTAGSLYDAVERLRPRWLRPRAQQSLGALSTAVVVYQGQTRLGGVEVLRQMAANSAARLRFLDAATAAASLPGLGSQHVAGAIVIETTVRPGR